MEMDLTNLSVGSSQIGGQALMKEDLQVGWSIINKRYSFGTPGFLRHPYTTASSATGIPQVLDALGIDPNALYEWKPYDSVGEFFKQVMSLVTILMLGAQHLTEL